LQSRRHNVLNDAGRLLFAGHTLRAELFRLKFAPDSIEAVRRRGRTRLEWEFVMSTEHPPRDEQDNKSQDQDDEFLAALSPLLEAADGLQGKQAPRRQTTDVLLLLEENARLRKLAVKLSNLLGDLPARSA